MNRVAYMLGSGIGHSVSPGVHNPVADELGLDWRYELWDLETEALPDALRRIREEDCSGANITMPHKAWAAEFSDSRTGAVERSGAANVLVNEGGHLTAHNTDVDGARELLGMRREQVASGPAVIVGAGGAAAATIEALRDLGPPEVLVLARRPEAAEVLADRLAPDLPFPISGHPLEHADQAVPEASLLVNATAVGMGTDRTLPDWARPVHGGLLVYDYVYRRESATALIDYAVDRGAEVCDGAAHVLAQAGPTFRLLASIEAPPGSMRRALARELGRDPQVWVGQVAAS